MILSNPENIIMFHCYRLLPSKGFPSVITITNDLLKFGTFTITEKLHWRILDFQSQTETISSGPVGVFAFGHINLRDPGVRRIFLPGRTWVVICTRSSWEKTPPHTGVDPGKLNERTLKGWSVIICWAVRSPAVDFTKSYDSSYLELGRVTSS